MTHNSLDYSFKLQKLIQPKIQEQQEVCRQDQQNILYQKYHCDSNKSFVLPEIKKKQAQNQISTITPKQQKKQPSQVQLPRIQNYQNQAVQQSDNKIQNKFAQSDSNRKKQNISHSLEKKEQNQAQKQNSHSQQQKNLKNPQVDQIKCDQPQRYKSAKGSNFQKQEQTPIKNDQAKIIEKGNKSYIQNKEKNDQAKKIESNKSQSLKKQETTSQKNDEARRIELGNFQNPEMVSIKKNELPKSPTLQNKNKEKLTTENNQTKRIERGISSLFQNQELITIKNDEGDGIESGDSPFFQIPEKISIEDDQDERIELENDYVKRIVQVNSPLLQNSQITKIEPINNQFFQNQETLLNVTIYCQNQKQQQFQFEKQDEDEESNQTIYEEIDFRCFDCEEQIECNICQLPCHHNYHNECLQRCIQNQLNEIKCYQVQCQCNQLLNLKTIEQRFTEFAQIILNRQLAVIKEKYAKQIQSCTSCNFFSIYDSKYQISPVFICPKCMEQVPQAEDCVSSLNQNIQKSLSIKTVEDNPKICFQVNNNFNTNNAVNSLLNANNQGTVINKNHTNQTEKTIGVIKILDKNYNANNSNFDGNPQAFFQYNKVICSHCNQQIELNFLQLNCLHFYHIECIQDVIQKQALQVEYQGVKCFCERSIDQQFIRQVYNNLLSIIFAKQLIVIKKQQDRKILACSFCEFFCINKPEERDSYCPNCFIKISKGSTFRNNDILYYVY